MFPDHADTDELVPPRRAEPRHRVARSGRWYLVAFDLDRSDWRTSGRRPRCLPPLRSLASCPPPAGTAAGG
ncbi:WYL domain-containing protein [Blastococcus sp. SYSU DS0617]